MVLHVLKVVNLYKEIIFCTIKYMQKWALVFVLCRLSIVSVKWFSFYMHKFFHKKPEVMEQDAGREEILTVRVFPRRPWVLLFTTRKIPYLVRALVYFQSFFQILCAWSFWCSADILFVNFMYVVAWVSACKQLFSSYFHLFIRYVTEHKFCWNY